VLAGGGVAIQTANALGRSVAVKRGAQQHTAGGQPNLGVYQQVVQIPKNHFLPQSDELFETQKFRDKAKHR
jgi:hypothetical protein